ncbi:hypothetical protein BGZ47_004732 [Haplosporangium gracile]|nr:hypothetical protein BGZ47_004732 [Haplosporangium gracile]
MNFCNTSSSPEILKSSSKGDDSKPTTVANYVEMDNKSNNSDENEGESESDNDSEDVPDSPTTTTIYYYPPTTQAEEALEPSPSPSSDTRSSPLLAKSDHRVWYLRHIGQIPAASASSPEVHHLRQHYHHLHYQHLYHDKNCEFARRSTVEPGQYHAITQKCPKKQEDDLSPSSSSISSVPKIKSPIVSHYYPPTHYEIRRSSANYSLEALKNEKWNNSRSSSRASATTKASTSRNSANHNSSSSSLSHSSSRHPQHSVETIAKLRDSIRGLSHFESAPSSSLSTASKKASSSNNVQPAAKSSPTVAVSNNNTPAATTFRARPPCPRNSLMISKSIQMPASGTTNATTTATTTTTMTTRTTGPASTDNSYEHLIQKVDALAREVQIMKQQHSYTLISSTTATNNDSNSTTDNNENKAAFSSDAPTQAFRNNTGNLSTVSLPLPSVLEHSSLRALAAKKNNASLSTPSLPFPTLAIQGTISQLITATAATKATAV